MFKRNNNNNRFSGPMNPFQTGFNPGMMNPGMPGGMNQGMPGGMHQGMPGGMSQGMPGGMHQGMPGSMHQGMPGGMQPESTLYPQVNQDRLQFEIKENRRRINNLTRRIIRLENYLRIRDTSDYVNVDDDQLPNEFSM